MKNVARDLLLLAAVAYKNGKFDTAGSLFASSMASEDADALMSKIHEMDMEQESNSSDKTLNEIAKILGQSMSDDSDLETPEEGTESDDMDPNNPGERIVPSSISSEATLTLVKASKSPISVK